MDNKEKILELLNKEELTSEEKALFDDLLKDPEVLQTYNAYTKVKKIIRSGSHVSYDQLYNYILLKNGNEPEDKNIVAQLPLIEEHLRNCSKCLDEFTTLNDEYSGIENFVSYPAEVPEVKDSSLSQRLFFSRSFAAARYSFLTVFAIGFVYLMLFFISDASTSDTFKYASVKDDTEFYVTRGRPTDDFQKSLTALENENYSDAIQYLETDIKSSGEDETVFYSHYILGLTYLQSAEKNFLGLFPSFDEDRVTKGIKNLENAVALNQSGKFRNVTYDAYFYLAKGNLMLQKKDEGSKYLQLVIENKGSKIQEAKNILSGLE